MQRLFLSKLIAYDYWLNMRKGLLKCGPIQRCPCCGNIGRFKKHGYYKRYYNCKEFSDKIEIRRYICPSKGCNHTISMLPNFCHPKFINGIKEIFICLTEYFETKGTVKEVLETVKKLTGVDLSRQLLHHYSKRLIDNLRYIKSTLRVLDSKIKLPEDLEDKKEKAKKVLTLVNNWSCTINMLSQRFHEETLITLLCKQKPL
jgi:hypothetical protein